MSVSVFAEDAVIDGIKYSLNNETLQAKVIPNYDNATTNYLLQENKYSGNIIIPEAVDYNGKTYSVTSIGNNAFFNCTGLTSVTIPNSVIIIRNNAFSGCSALTSITIPNSIEYIGESAFAGCSALTSITVEKGNLAYNSRENCNAVIDSETNELILGCKNTVIPNSVTSIGNYAFYGCYGLTSVTIPNSVKKIDYHAFHDCKSLTSVTSMIEEPFEIEDNVFTYYGKLNYEWFTEATLYVPAGTKSKYESTPAWNMFENIVEQEVNAVESVETDVQVEETERYNVSGQRIGTPQKGINIVKMSDGTTRKVMCK